jgi:hypothetical protein
MVSLAGLGTHAATGEPATPRFVATACDLPGITPALAPRLRCGTVAMPRANPAAGPFNLAVATAPTPEALARRHAADMACRDQAIAAGIDLRDFGTNVTAEDFDAVRRALFAGCTAQPGCAAAFPDLAGLYRNTVARLARVPLTAALPSQPGQPARQITLTADLFTVLVGELAYYPPADPATPPDTSCATRPRPIGFLLK